MNFIVFYLNFNLVLSVAVITLSLISFTIRPYARQLRLHYAILGLALLLPGIGFLKGGGVFQPVAKVWSGNSPKIQNGSPSPKGILHIREAEVPVPAEDLFLFIIGIAFGALTFGFWRFIRGILHLSKIIRGASTVRSLGRVRVLVSDEIKIPFSYRSLARAYVLLPAYLISSSNSLRMALSHELQHHRQRDTFWAYAFLLVRAFCFFNPFVHLWSRWIGEIQEFACDEALAGRLSFKTRDYARCLIEVAETAWVHEEVPEGATGMILLSRGQLLNRRIQVMFKEKQFSPKWAGTAGFALVAVLMTGTAFAAKNLVQDRRVTLTQAKDWAEKAVPKGAVFPIVVNEEVLKYLNHFIGTAEGREHMRQALRRLRPYRVMVEAKLAEYNVPPELMAIPIIESGYQNLEDRNVTGWGAGLWMFIESTARAYGMTVNGKVDQRLDEPRETDAAMRYLVANHARFSNWQLSVLAYNAGENAVQQAIFATGSRDPWVLVRESNLSAEAKNYLPKLMAAIVIMRNPSTVE